MRKVIDKIIEVLCTLIMGYMVLAVCWQVITRFILKNPSTLTEEILRYLLVWTTMVGGAYAYGRRKHLSINMLSKKLPFKGQKILDIGVQVIVIVFCLIVMIQGACVWYRPRSTRFRQRCICPCLTSTPAFWSAAS